MAESADHLFMARALMLARRGLYTTDPNPRVGCVIVRDGQVIGEGWHRCAGEPHAEAIALAEAGERARGATAFITLEPCCHHGRTPPCTDALLRAGVTRVVCAMEDPNPRVAGRGFAQLRAAGVQVQSGLLEEEAKALNRGFIRRMTGGRPLVRAKLAASLDGRTAMASGESRWITGEAARADVQHWRARAGAIVTGVGTVLGDDPRLDVRLPSYAVRQPMRIILDTHLRTPAMARILAPPGRAVILCGRAKPDRHAVLEAAGARVVTGGCGPDGRVDPAALLSLLQEIEVNEVHVEAGPTLSGALLGAGLVDELVMYLAPLVLGAAARGLFDVPGLERMAQGVQLQDMRWRAVGRDWRVRARVVPAGTVS